MENDLITRYKEAAIAHGEGTRSGDSDKANKAHDALRELLREITASNGDDGLFALYDEEDPWVQLWSATHTLEVDEKRASAKLQSIVDARIPVASMTARYTLQEWKDGSLAFRV